ncbi:MAG: undecaprenyldiphospho-muramoylpentapeptide beta-N-acetylglucosaminyltransferase, partial [Lysobacterales bacterium]
ECQRVSAAGFALDVVDISGLRGKGLVRWLCLPLQLFRAVRQSFVLIGRHRPACAMSFGGFAAGPGGIAARLRGVPLLVHEQNRIPGLTNRFLAHAAKRVFEAFPGTWPQRTHAITCGNPVRRDLTQLPPPATRLALRKGRPRLLITGGSQGAQALNRVLPEAIALLNGAAVPEIRHQAGKNRAEETATAYAAAGLEARVDEFIEDMAAAYCWADLVVCRSGALTISELAAVGIGSVLVPFPYAVDDHQTRNAEFLAETGAACLLPESDCNAASLARILETLFSNRDSLLRMAQAARELALPDSAARVAQACMEYCSLRDPGA